MYSRQKVIPVITEIHHTCVSFDIQICADRAYGPKLILIYWIYWPWDPDFSLSAQNHSDRCRGMRSTSVWTKCLTTIACHNENDSCLIRIAFDSDVWRLWAPWSCRIVNYSGILKACMYARTGLPVVDATNLIRSNLKHISKAPVS